MIYKCRELKNLHSNMVRFIIYNKNKEVSGWDYIYIPIWLDLLYKIFVNEDNEELLFTFQYG